MGEHEKNMGRVNEDREIRRRRMAMNDDNYDDESWFKEWAGW